MPDFDVVVIGAGCGGLAAGALLAHRGRKVLVVEQASAVGGCCSTFEKDGFLFDTGATILEIVDPIALAFEMLGTTFAGEVGLETCDPIYKVILKDGSGFTIPLSDEQTAAAISAISPADGAGWQRYAARLSGFIDTALKGFFVEPACTAFDMLRMLARTPGLLRYGDLFASSYQSVIERYFHDDAVRQSMSYQTFYCGLPPALAPGVFAMFPYSEHRGLFYPRGGMIRIPEAFRRCGESDGMEIRLNTRVKGVIVRGGRAHGVELADGTEITSRVVLSDINAKTLYLDMIAEEHLPRLARRGIRSYELSVSAPVLYLGVDYEPPLEAHHSLLAVPMETLNDYWWNRYEKGLLPKEQFGLVCWPTRTDPSLAPEGMHVLNIILAGPYRLRDADWDTEKSGFAERAVKRLSETAIHGLKDHVVTMEVATPLDFERRLLMPEGSFLALQMDVPSLTVFRPSARSRSVRGLYLAGSSTHPGGGVPTTVASGIIAASLIERYES